MGLKWPKYALFTEGSRNIFGGKSFLHFLGPKLAIFGGTPTCRQYGPNGSKKGKIWAYTGQNGPQTALICPANLPKASGIIFWAKPLPKTLPPTTARSGGAAENWVPGRALLGNPRVCGQRRSRFYFYVVFVVVACSYYGGQGCSDHSICVCMMCRFILFHHIGYPFRNPGAHRPMPM